MNSDPLSICMVSPMPPPYGGISHWTAMINQRAERDSSIRLSVVDIAPRWREVDDLATWKRVLGGGIQLLRDAARIGAKLISRPHVLHLTTAGQLAVYRDLVAITMSRFFHVPVVYHLRFGRIAQLAGGRSWEWRFLARAMRLAHTVIPIDAATERAIRKYLPEVHVAKIPNCIDIGSLPEPPALASTTRTVMFLGWVVPTKGIEELVRAWSELRPAGWRLLIVGPGSIDFQKDLLSRYQASDLEFLGEKPHQEAMEILAASDVLVLPSYTEGFPNVVVESMALGKAIVATRVGAIPEMLADGCGVLIEPRDTAGLKEALRNLLADADMREDLGNRARQRATVEFSLDAVYARYTALWRKAARLCHDE